MTYSPEHNFPLTVNSIFDMTTCCKHTIKTVSYVVSFYIITFMTDRGSTYVSGTFCTFIQLIKTET